MSSRRSAPAPSATAVENQVAATVTALEATHPGRRAALQRNPIAEISSWNTPALIITAAPRSTLKSACELAGSYRNSESGPQIVVVEAFSRARQQFTALHELGHHLQQTSAATARTLAYQPAGDRQLEEAACDGFAAEVLLPAAHVDIHVGERGPSAHDVIALFENSPSASRAACCVAAVRRLRSPGHVLLLDETGTMLFAASHGYPRPRVGSDQSDCRLVAKALDGYRTARTDNARLVYGDGKWAGEVLHGDSAWHHQYLFAVLTVDQVPWLPLAARAPEPPMLRRQGWWGCESCEQYFQRDDADMCNRCGNPRCPHCSACPCRTHAASTVCDRCFTTLSAHEQSRGLQTHEECP